MKYILTSRREEAVTIDGLGVLPAATRPEDGSDELVPSETVFDKVQAAAFAYQRGLSLASATLPQDVELTISLEGVE